MIIKNVNLETVCGITSSLPDNEFSEIAFAGKSNVGKSSLINGLINRKAYARTSSEPGKTQTINYYRVTYREGTKKQSLLEENDGSRQLLTDHDIYFVDLPGYGYAKVSAQTREKWGAMIERYLHTSRVLREVFLLVDIRHEPSQNDCQMFDWIVDAGFTPIVIATKLDKIKKSQLQKQLKMIRQKLGMKPGEPLIPFSAETKQGRDEIWSHICGSSCETDN